MAYNDYLETKHYQYVFSCVKKSTVCHLVPTLMKRPPLLQY